MADLKWFLAVLKLPLLLISGCASFDAQHMPLEVSKAVITVIPNAKFKSPRQRGKAVWYFEDGVRHCTIMLSAYPAYLGHEAAHCFSGQWHGKNENGWDF